MNFSEVTSPAVISSVVAVGSLILSFFKLFKENDANAKKIGLWIYLKFMED